RSRTNSGALERNLLRVSPETLELIKVAQRRMKDVDDEVYEVEQHPAALFQPFNVVHRKTLLLQLGHDVLTECSNMGVGGTAGDQKEIRHVGDSAKVEEYDVLSL